MCGCNWESAARINLSHLCVRRAFIHNLFCHLFCNPCKIYLCFAINDASSSFGYWIRWNTALGSLLKPIHGSTSFTLFCRGLPLFREIRPFLILLRSIRCRFGDFSWRVWKVEHEYYKWLYYHTASNRSYSIELKNHKWCYKFNSIFDKQTVLRFIRRIRYSDALESA